VNLRGTVDRTKGGSPVSVRRLLTILICSPLGVLAPGAALAQAVPWNATVLNGTIVSVDAASLTVRDEQGFLRHVSLAGAPRTALSPGMVVTVTGYRDPAALQATRVDALPRLAPPVPAIVPVRPISPLSPSITHR
jgi:hypothetical protein